MPSPRVRYASPDLPLTPEQRHARARAAAYASHGNQAEADRISAELKADRLEQHIKALVDTWPPLTQEQRDKLAVILRGAPVADPERTSARRTAEGGGSDAPAA